MKIFFYVLDLMTVNGWLLYCRMLNKKSKQHVFLCDFKLDIATWLLSSNKYIQRGRRPSQQDNPPKKKRKSVHPAESVRWDGGGHLPSCVKTTKV